MRTETGARILTDARAIFLTEGIDAVTMRTVAARSGITPMAIYRHYANRDALVRAVCGEGHRIFFEYLQRSLSEPGPWERLLASGRAYLEFALDHPRDYALIFLDSSPALHAAGPGWQDAATFRFLVDRIRECADERLLKTDDPEDAALSIWAQVHGLVSLFLAGKLQVDRPAFESLYFRSVGRFITAFGAKPTRNQPAVYAVDKEK